MAATSDMFDNIRAYIEGTGRFFSQREKTPVLWQLEQLRAENERLRKALAFYSKESNYQLATATGHIRNESPVAEDNGYRAREALNESPAQGAGDTVEG